MGIVKHLLKEGYCFAVMQSYSWLTKGKMMQNQEWEILALRNDYQDLKKRGFELLNDPALKVTERNPREIISRIMTLEEISEFRQMKDEYFTKVQDDENGMLWEITRKPLKTTLKIT